MMIVAVYDCPAEVNLGHEGYLPSIRRMQRLEGEIWISGDGILLSSLDGKIWMDRSFNLRSEGAFTVLHVGRDQGEPVLFARSRAGLRYYKKRTDLEYGWQPISQLESSSPFFAASVGPHGGVLTALTQVGRSAIQMESFDAGKSWNRSFLNITSNPAALTVDTSGRFVSVFWESVKDRETLKVFRKLDTQWTLAQELQSMPLCVSERGPGQLHIGAPEGRIVDCSLDVVAVHQLPTKDDVVATDLSEIGVSITESDDASVHTYWTPAENGQWAAAPVPVEGRVCGVCSLGPAEFVVCTSKSIYRSTLDLDSLVLT